MPKLIDAAGAAQARLTVEGEIPISSLPRLGDLSQPPYGEVHVKIGFMTGDRGRPAVLGNATTTVRLSCQRCLETMPVELSARVNVLVEDVEQAERLTGRSRASKQFAPKHAHSKHANTEHIDLREIQHNSRKGEDDQIAEPAGEALKASEAAAADAELIEASASRFALHQLLEDELLLSLPDAPVHPQGQCEAPSFGAGDTLDEQGDGGAAGDETLADKKPPSPFAILEALKSDDNA